MPYFEDGHFYSPVVDPAQARRSVSTLWPSGHPRPIPNVDFSHETQRRTISEILRPHLADFDYVDGSGDRSEIRFRMDNDQFSGLDARLLFCFLRHYAPRRIVEVGSGYSTLLMCDVNRRFLGGRTSIECIEPFPREFLLEMGGEIALHRLPVQQVPMTVFDRLEAGDILFIDSSHVAKTGSDVNHLFFEVLPRLAPGVIVHVHDIFLPFEYPEHWVVNERRSWNEQYLLRALLTDSDSYEVLFGAAYADHHFQPELKAVHETAGQRYRGGASFWMTKRR